MNSKDLNLSVPASIIIGAVFIGLVLLFSNKQGGAPAPTQQQPQQQAVAVDITKVHTTDDPYIGNPNAPFEMAYWSDYQCPYCKQFDTTILPQVIQKYVDSGKIRIVFKDFQFLGPDSDTDALYARAVWHLYPQQFGAWHAAMYANQPQENTLSAADNEKHVRDITASIPGIDVNKVIADEQANSATYEKLIAADRSEGQSYGINATPSFVIGKQLIIGAQSYDQVSTAIDSALH